MAVIKKMNFGVSTPVLISAGADIGPGEIILGNDYTRLLLTAGNTGTNLSVFSLLVRATKEDANYQTYLTTTGWDTVAGTLKKFLGTLKTLATGSRGFADIDIGPVYAIKFNAGIASGALSFGTGTFTGLPTAGQTITIGTHVYTWRATVGATADEVLIGADAAACCVNLIAAVNADPAQAGTLFGSATVAHTQGTLAQGAGTTVVFTVNSDINMTVGNAIATTETSSNFSWGGATLAGGVTTALTITCVACD